MPVAIFLSLPVTAKDDLVTHRVATNRVKGQRRAKATDDDFTVNLPKVTFQGGRSGSAVNVEEKEEEEVEGWWGRGTHTWSF